jgi:aryl-alcohol dehydrogenase-like predicted oxidoreductase
VVLPIPGTADLRHLEENLAAERIKLTVDHRATLENVYMSAPA